MGDISIWVAETLFALACLVYIFGGISLFGSDRWRNKEKHQRWFRGTVNVVLLFMGVCAFRGAKEWFSTNVCVGLAAVFFWTYMFALYFVGKAQKDDSN